MRNFYQRWKELRPLYRALLLVFALMGIAAVADAVETIMTLIEITR